MQSLGAKSPAVGSPKLHSGKQLHLVSPKQAALHNFGASFAWNFRLHFLSASFTWKPPALEHCNALASGTANWVELPRRRSQLDVCWSPMPKCQVPMTKTNVVSSVRDPSLHGPVHWQPKIESASSSRESIKDIYRQASQGSQFGLYNAPIVS